MEHQTAHSQTPLQLKLKLLNTLSEGNIHQTQKILEELSRSSQSHPQLYQKFHSFVSEHKAEIIEIDHAEKEEEQPNAIIADTDSNGSWDTDESANWSDEEIEEEEEPKQVKKAKPKLSKNLTNMVNSKSAVTLKPVKQVKRPFHIQTKAKQNTNSTVNLRRQSSPSNKLISMTQNVAGFPSKTKPLTKLDSKKTTKSFFPPISCSKATLKLS